MELQGEIIKIGETETIGAKGFQKRQLVIKTSEQYPQSVPVDFTQDKCIVLNGYAVGDLVVVGVNVRGSEWQGKYYASLNGWKISKTDSEKSSQSFMPDREERSDLPF